MVGMAPLAFNMDSLQLHGVMDTRLQRYFNTNDSPRDILETYLSISTFTFFLPHIKACVWVL